MQTLEMAVDDAIMRIKREYERTEGKIYLSFSGGKDSTILAELIKMANLPINIQFVFANTGIELDATLKFVNEYDYENLTVIKPEKPFGMIIREYGKPVISKTKSEHLYTYQKHINEPFKTVRQKHLILGEQISNGGKPQGKRTNVGLAIKDFHFLHHDLEYKISNKCCDYLKKKPFKIYVKQSGMNGVFTGVRTSEGGARSLVYKSCVVIKNVKGKDFYTSMPIFDWSDEICNEFIEKYNVKLSRVYTTYKLKRSGCMLCPFSRDLHENLKVLYEHEPLNYKASMFWLKDVFVDQGIECEWDQEYMDYFNERQPIIDKRKKEMIDKFSPYFNPEIRKRFLKK